MSIDMRMLRLFITVCETGNISRAAQILHISQPALTRRIQDLEDHYGTKLFERSRKGVVLTESGFHLQIRAKELLALAERTAREMEEGLGRFGGIVRIGLVESNVSSLAAQWLQEWTAQRPNACYELYAADGDAIRERLDTDQLDLAFVLEPVETAKYESVQLTCRDRWGVVMRRDHPLAGVEALNRENLTQLPLILPRRHIVRETLASSFGALANQLRVAGYQNLLTNSLELVRLGACCCLAIEGAFRIRETSDLVFVPLWPTQYSAHRLIRRRNHQISFSAENFWQHCLTKTDDILSATPAAK